MPDGKPEHAATAVVCGAGGFIGHHLVRRLRNDGIWVRGVDIRPAQYGASSADEYLILDLRKPADCLRAVAMTPYGAPPDQVYQLAADMGGMGFISVADCEVLRDNSAINANMTHASAENGVGRYFLSSSVCVYRDMAPGESELSEADAYPARPDNEYGWEKLYAERIALAYARRYGMNVRIARFQNCYGPEGAWTGGREKAPAAVCRKVAEAREGGAVQLWGDGTAIRSFIHVRDLIDAVVALMMSHIEEPTNIGSREYVSVQELFDVVARVSGKNVRAEYIPGPVGVRSRNFSNDRIESLGWKANISLEEGIRDTYAWIAAQVDASRSHSPAPTPALPSIA